MSKRIGGAKELLEDFFRVASESVASLEVYEKCYSTFAIGLLPSTKNPSFNFSSPYLS